MKNKKRSHTGLMHFLFSIGILLFVGFASFFTDCSNRRNKFHPISYFPVNAGNTWIFDGDIYKMEITGITKGEEKSIISMSYFDSTGIFLWKEKYILLKDQIYFESFEPHTTILPKVLFDPPLPLAPFSSKPGHKIILESKETHSDSIKSESQILVTYEIEGVEDVSVPAGAFLNCIKMKVNVQYPQFALEPFFIGDQYWWFAPMVGPVKYDLPSAYGELSELKLSKSRLLQTP